MMRLPRDSPTSRGVDPGGVLALIADADRAGIDLHSLMIVRGGAVIAEGWWHPYRADQWHLLYSLSKTFTASAVALAIGEGRLRLDDPIVAVLGRSALADGVSELRIRHLLAMASGHDHDTIEAMRAAGDPVGAILASPLAAPPGTLFTYNQGCTYLLSAAIRQVTGLQLHEYLRPRLFDPLGIGPVHWRQLAGLDQGFSGLHARTEDVAKLGVLYAAGGCWNGTRLLPADYVAQATRSHVDTAGRQDNPDWQQGYGFQLWRCRPDAYRGDGAFGQFCVVVPHLDLVIVTTAQTMRMQDLADLFWAHLLPAVDRPPTASDGELAARLANLTVPPAPEGGTVGPLPAGHYPVLQPAEFVDITAVDIAGSAMTVHTAGGHTTGGHTAGGSHHQVPLTAGWTAARLPVVSRLLGDSQVAGGWVAGTGTVEVDVIFVDSPHRLRLSCRPGPEPHCRLRWWTQPL